MKVWLCACALAAAVLLWPSGGSTSARVRALTRVARIAGGEPVPPPRRLRLSAAVTDRSAWLAGGLLGAVVGWRAGVAIGLATAAGSGCLASQLAAVLARRRSDRAARALQEAVRLVVAEVTAGTSVDGALRSAAAVGPPWAAPFTAAADRVGVGDPPIAAFEAPALRPVAASLTVAMAAGAPVAEVLGRVDSELGAAEARRRSVAVILAGPRSSAALLAGLALVGVGLGLAMGARPQDVLLHSSGGRLLLCTGVVLDVVGMMWTGRLARRAEAAP